jgi:hypothetical protein
MIEGNLEVKLLTVRTNGKAEVGRVRKEKGRRKRSKKSKTEERRPRRAKRKDRKVVKHCVFQMFCGSGGSKSRLAKAPGAEPSGEDER